MGCFVSDLQELDATARGWQRAQQRGLVVASLRARLRAAAGSSEWWWRCTHSGGVWEADPEAAELDAWSDGEGVDEGATGAGGRPRAADMYRRDSFINDDAEGGSEEYDDDDDDDDQDEDDDDDDDEDDAEEEEEESEEESDSSMERYARRGW
jgi:hypothetical protein